VFNEVLLEKMAVRVAVALPFFPPLLGLANAIRLSDPFPSHQPHSAPVRGLMLSLLAAFFFCTQNLGSTEAL